METKKVKENKLQLIPKAEKYIEYILQIILKLPRTEKFNIGNEYKISMYQMLKNIMYITKIEKAQALDILNKIDAELNTQRIYLRIMKNNKWIDERKFRIAMEQIYEIGKILGGLIKYYAKDIKKLELNKKKQIFKSKQGVNFCGYKINEYRLKIRDKGKRKLKNKVKKLEKLVKEGKITSKEAHKYLAGHMGYIKIANVKNLTEKLFYTE